MSSLSRAVAIDIERAAKAVEAALHPCIHTFIATSDVHMKYKLKMEPQQVYDRAMEAVRLAKKYAPVVEFSCEDATRSDREFLYKILEGVINEGAAVLNIPDTVGYIEPMEYYDLIQSILQKCSEYRQSLSFPFIAMTIWEMPLPTAWPALPQGRPMWRARLTASESEPVMRRLRK